jgi:hypothetical protein
MRKTRVLDLRRALALTCALAGALLSLFAPATSAAPARQKMTAEEVVAKHLESIGAAEARAAAQSRIMAGTSRATFRARSSSGSIDGRVVFASKENKVLLGMGFDAPNYPGEKFGFDGKKFTVGYVTPGVRSALGNFVLTHNDAFREGLMGGTLSSAWPLLNLSERKAKLEYAGTEKVNDRPAHKLRYSPNKGSDLRITLYFDADTFRHVRTLYERVVGAGLGTGGGGNANPQSSRVDNSASQRETRYKMIEEFSDFKAEGKLTLPHSYKLQLEIDKTGGSSLDKWEMTFEQFGFDQDIDENSFNVEAG